MFGCLRTLLFFAICANNCTGQEPYKEKKETVKDEHGWLKWSSTAEKDKDGVMEYKRVVRNLDPEKACRVNWKCGESKLAGLVRKSDTISAELSIDSTPAEQEGNLTYNGGPKAGDANRPAEAWFPKGMGKTSTIRSKSTLSFDILAKDGRNIELDTMIRVSATPIVADKEILGIRYQLEFGLANDGYDSNKMHLLSTLYYGWSIFEQSEIGNDISAIPREFRERPGILADIQYAGDGSGVFRFRREGGSNSNKKVFTSEIRYDIKYSKLFLRNTQFVVFKKGVSSDIIAAVTIPVIAGDGR